MPFGQRFGLVNLTDYADLEKRLRERAYAVAAASPVMSDETGRTAKVLVEAADAIAALARQLEEARDDATRRAIDQGCLRGTLTRLIRLTDAKDAGFKRYVEEEAYRAAKADAWAAARIAAEPFLSRDLQSGNVGDNEVLRERPADAAPDASE